MTSAFAKHGIAHLSSSSLVLWREHPGLWCLRYLANVKDDAGPAAWRGKAVEDALSALLHNCPIEQANDIARTTFDANAAGEIADDIEKQRGLLVPMVRQASIALTGQVIELVGTQIKIEYWMDGIEIPFIGYVDYLFTEGLWDLKTTERLPSAPKPAHVRQVALYWAARQLTPTLFYLTDKKFAFYPIGEDDCLRALDELRADALSLEGFLGRIDSATDALHCLPINSDDYRVNEQIMTAHQALLGA